MLAYCESVLCANVWVMPSMTAVRLDGWLAEASAEPVLSEPMKLVPEDNMPVPEGAELFDRSELCDASKVIVELRESAMEL